MWTWLLFACSAAAPDVYTLDTGADAPPVTFGFPLPERTLFKTRVGVDNDTVVQENTLAGRVQCVDYLERGFPNCYDEHHGSDFMLEGGFDTMDAGSTPIVAAAPGVVVEIEQDQYDRCHADINTGNVNCDGHPMLGNHVILAHAGGLRTLYWHMKTDSVVVAVGDVVACGDKLGLVGSSGISSAPHLHFQVEDEAENWIDPYAGPASQSTSYWTDQRGPDELPGPGCTE